MSHLCEHNTHDNFKVAFLEERLDEKVFLQNATAFYSSQQQTLRFHHFCLDVELSA